MVTFQKMRVVMKGMKAKANLAGTSGPGGEPSGVRTDFDIRKIFSGF